MEPTDSGWSLGSSCTLLKEMHFALAEDFGYWTGLTASGRAQQGDIAELALDDLDAEIMVEVHNQSGGIATGVVHTGELLQVGQATSCAADRDNIEQQSLAEQPAAKLCRLGIAGHGFWGLPACAEPAWQICKGCAQLASIKP